MSEHDTATPTEPKKRGWPKGKPRKVLAAEPKAQPKAAPKWEMTAKPNWETVDPTSDKTADRLRIPKDMIPEGMDLVWVMDSVLGQPDSQWRGRREQEGWTPVHQRDFNGRFDGLFMSRGKTGEINVGGLVLMTRPLEFSLRQRAADERAAKEAVLIKEQSWRTGEIQGVTLDAKHQTAVNSNRISRTLERLEIPEK